MKKPVKFIFEIVFMLLFASLFFIGSLVVKADLNSIELLSQSLTDDDYYNYNNSTYTIADYIYNWDGINIGRGSGYGQRIQMCGSSYRFDDNDIVNIIPKDLFYTIGSYHYIGKEYGFYINTEIATGWYYYRSYVVVYDINYELIDISKNTTSCKIELLLCLFLYGGCC